MSKTIGYIVMESCEDYEQGLTVKAGPNLPPGGILDWHDKGGGVAMFASRADARAAIERTEHYRKAFGLTTLPEKANCRIAPVHSANGTGEAGK